MRFNGFRSIAEFESECRKCGQPTVRIPFVRGDEKFFVLISDLEHRTATSVAAWHLFTEDEEQNPLNGVINGWESNFLGKLAAQGYSPAVEVPERYRNWPKHPAFSRGEGGD